MNEKVFEGRLDRTGTKRFKNTISLLSNFLDEVTMKIEDGEITIEEADRSMVALFRVRFKRDMFSEYNFCLDNVEAHSVGVNLNNTDDFLGEFEKLNIEITEDEITLSQEGTEFKQNLLDLSSGEKPDIDGLEFEKGIELKTGMLRNICKKGDNLSEHVDFIINDKFKAVAQTNGSRYRKEVELNDRDIFMEGEEDEVRSSYPLEYLKKLLKDFKKIADSVEVRMGSDFPLQVSNEEEDYKVIFVLAPRVED